jgi:hypothetical protein
MATWSNRNHTGALLRAAETWKARCLLGNGSVLTDDQLWSKDNVEALKVAFVDNLIEGDRTFYDKLQEQLQATSPAVKKLASECIWLLLLFVSDRSFSAPKKRQRISQVWAYSGEQIPNSPFLADDVLGGLARPGAAFLTLMWVELEFLLKLLSSWKALAAPAQEELLTDNSWGFCQWVTSQPGGDVRVFRHMLLYLCYPGDFEPICSRTAKKRIYATFSAKLDRTADPYSVDHTPCGLDKSLLAIRGALESERGTKELSFYLSPLKELWQDTKPTVSVPTPEPELDQSQGVWVEKTIVEGRPDRTSGPHQLGAALWSPQRSTDGRDIYANMRQVAVGDVVLHLTDNEAITGVSRVKAPADPSFVGLPDTAWAGQPGYRIPLEDFQSLDPPLPRDAFLGDPEFEAELRSILTSEAGRGLFYNRDLDLNQGAYLTEAPATLVSVLNRAYQKIATKPLPYLDDEEVAPPPDVYTAEIAAEDLFFGIERIDRLLSIWATKQNLILQGPPGVGKTFAARRLASALVGSSAPDRLGFVQFHQSYSYEDFVQGYRPDGVGFSLKNGLFYEFCQRALAAPQQRYAFIIDEINRGNLSRIFGELLMLIEADKRGKEWAMPLVYGDASKPFHMPNNVFILGLMNTADRSLAMMDYALRRRFAFEELAPQFNSQKFEVHLKGNDISDRLITTIRQRMNALNETIERDVSNLGRGFCIGHSFFCQRRAAGQSELDWYRGVVETEVLPLLSEYWFDNQARISEWQQRLLEAS